MNKALKKVFVSEDTLVFKSEEGNVVTTSFQNYSIDEVEEQRDRLESELGMELVSHNSRIVLHPRVVSAFPKSFWPFFIGAMVGSVNIYIWGLYLRFVN